MIEIQLELFKCLGKFSLKLVLIFNKYCQSLAWYVGICG